MKATIIAVVGVAVVAAGCGGGGASDGESAKTSAIAPVTLRIGTDDEPGKPAADQIEELARRAAKLSGGAIRIEPVWHAAGDGARLGPARGADGHERRARHGPDPVPQLGHRGRDEPARAERAVPDHQRRAARRVVSVDLADDLMAGLGEAGVHGHRAVPGGPAAPVRPEKPLMGPGDYDGEAIRTPTSKTTAAMFAALGASVDDDEAGPAPARGARVVVRARARAGRRPGT